MESNIDWYPGWLSGYVIRNIDDIEVSILKSQLEIKDDELYCIGYNRIEDYFIIKTKASFFNESLKEAGRLN